MDNKKNGIPKLRFPGFTGAWEQRKLGEIVEWSKGSGLSKDALNIQRIGVPVIHYADLYKFNSVQKEVIHWTMNNIGTKIPENNLLFPMSDVTPDGLARTSTVLQSNVKAGGDVLIAKLNKDILSTFMSYQINRNKNQILPLVTGTTVRHINSKSLSTLKVTVPGKNEQKYVGSILMRFDSLIALHQRKLEHLQEQKKGLLQKMFPKNGETVPEVRFPGFTDAWEQRKLGDFIIEFHEKTTVNDQYPILTSSRKGIFLQTDYYSGNQIASKDNTGYNIVPFGYFTYRHMSDDNIFRFNINKIVDKGIVSTLYPVFTTNKYLDSRYLQIQLNHGNEFAKYALLQKQGGSRTYMYLSKLKKLVLTMPKSTSEQKTISNFFDTLDSLITLHQRKLEHLELMKKGLLQQMFV